MSANREEREKQEIKIEEQVTHDSEDFEEAMREFSSSSAASRKKREPPKLPILPKIPEAVDDFLRNFLRRFGLRRTLSSFEKEWYCSAQKLQNESLRLTSAGMTFIPDALTHQRLLESELQEVQREVQLLSEEVQAAGDRLLRTKRERDFHKVQFRRVQEEKDKLMEDFKTLKKHVQSYEPVLRELEDKCQSALRQKMLLSLERDRARSSKSGTSAAEEEDRARSSKSGTSAAEEEDRARTSKSGTSAAEEEGGIRSSREKSQPLEKTRSPDPGPAQETIRTCKASFRLSSSIRAHHLPISCSHLHPRENILATASDDRTWRLWALPANGEKVGQMLLSGEGHSDWLSGCTFHPDGAKLATTSGDTTVRLWDSSRGSCMLTFCGHTQPAWSCSFHSCGHLLASCSSDRTIKLWDLTRASCWLTLRRHTASVSSVCFLPVSDLLLSCSADKTLALWDARTGLCTTIFQGHQHPCNHAAFSLAGNITGSCDSSGVVHLWDIRKPSAATETVDMGPSAANQVAFDPSGRTLVVACGDGVVRLVGMDFLAVSSLSGHSDSVQSVMFDLKGEIVISAGSDGMINLWS